MICRPLDLVFAEAHQDRRAEVHVTKSMARQARHGQKFTKKAS